MLIGDAPVFILWKWPVAGALCDVSDHLLLFFTGVLHRRTLPLSKYKERVRDKFSGKRELTHRSSLVACAAVLGKLEKPGPLRTGESNSRWRRREVSGIHSLVGDMIVLGRNPKASPKPDAVNTGPEPDAGPKPNAGSELDTGPEPDARPKPNAVNAEPELDAGQEPDARSKPNAEREPDAGLKPNVVNAC
ncbi:hypothetical protein CRG98_039153 [Punica granatum]|uniref:Uncharacterized protein n=1 Tax=Punica granatum TaxID=22663 RepID=A0A2I0I8W5_PUNGR|nr:hypothetical protein CRG98_039153 [Punica granatum]